MKSTCIVRRIDELGRVVLPKELRDSMELPKGSPMEIFTAGRDIIIRRYQPGCVFCGSLDDIVSFKGQFICAKCKAEVK